MPYAKNRQDGKYSDKTGKKFFSITVLKKAGKEIKNGKCHTLYLCKCDCGKEFMLEGSKIGRKKKKTCGCGNKRENLIGQTFGKLTVIKESSEQKTGDKWYSSIWDCECSCGRVVRRSSRILKNGDTVSCGCSKSKPKFKDREEFLWRKAYEVNILIANKRRSTEPSDISPERFKEIATQPCSYCGKPYDKVWKDVSKKNGRKISDTEIKFIGLDRIDSKIPYMNFNVVPCCDRCNTAKMDLSLFDWLNFIKRAHSHLYENGGIEKLLGVDPNKAGTSFFFPTTKKPTLL